jgi:hypothetical protein
MGTEPPAAVLSGTVQILSGIHEAACDSAERRGILPRDRLGDRWEERNEEAMEKPLRDAAVRMVIPSPHSVEFRLARAIARLGTALEGLVEQGWGESSRTRARLSSELTISACREAGNSRAAKVARAILALTQLSPAEVLPIQGSLREKLFELLGLLDDWTRSQVS